MTNFFLLPDPKEVSITVWNCGTNECSKLHLSRAEALQCPRRKVSRDAQIIYEVVNNNRTLVSVATEFKISPERVRQIVAKACRQFGLDQQGIKKCTTGNLVKYIKSMNAKLSTRARNALLNAGISEPITPEVVANKLDPQHIEQVPNIGKKSAQEITDWIRQAGYWS